MANQLAMDKSFAINNLRAAGYSERRIAQTLGVSRGAVRRHLRRPEANGTTAPTAPVGQAPTGSPDSNSTTAPTGSGDERPAAETVVAPTAAGSQCDPFREIIVAKCGLGLTAKRIHQGLVAHHGFSGKHCSLVDCASSWLACTVVAPALSFSRPHLHVPGIFP